MNRTAKLGALAGALAMSMLGAGISSATSAVAQDKAGAPAVGAPIKFFKPGANTIVKRNAEYAGPSSGGDAVQPFGGPYPNKVKHRQDLGEVCGTKVVSKTSGRGKTTLVLSVDKGVSAEWNAEVKVESEAVSAGMGFGVTKSYTVKNETRYEVPKGKMGTVEAYPLYNLYRAKIYNAVGIFQGNVTAMKPIGVCFNQWAK
ncbi:hypothetical protein IPZ61_23010 [Streptomyces sioyaensis]|uniref:hypothetical protein n=1 Tax=Streptomyces sioyaensis TaxID=67364 RepID=UPI001F29A76D|nr:hypothetical protein [Streptomyces sioyaensis]MCF3176176.1 hypothetical protein [Streptomyces sioyaensis]